MYLRKLELKDAPLMLSWMHDDPSIGVVIDRPTWREMLWLQKNSVLCVAASDYYEVEDYIRDYSEFKLYVDNTK